jgi:hypothetical protein
LKRGSEWEKAATTGRRKRRWKEMVSSQISLVSLSLLLLLCIGAEKCADRVIKYSFRHVLQKEREKKKKMGRIRKAH